MNSALIVVDMLNTYEHEDADRLTNSVRDALPGIKALIERARSEHVPVVYVNDNYGDFSACRPELVRHALDGRAPEFVEPIVPPDDVAFVVKARHSIFYRTQLEYLLRQQEIERIVLAGQVTEQCILYSALDGHVRHFAVRVPRDAVAAIHDDLAAAALRMMERNMGADVSDSRGVRAVALTPAPVAERERRRDRFASAPPGETSASRGTSRTDWTVRR